MNATLTTGRWRLGACAAALLLAGCSFPQKVGVTEFGNPRYARVALLYEVNTGRGALAPRFASAVPGEIMEIPRQVTSPVESAVMRLEYPHPHGRPGMARVAVRMSRLSIEERRQLTRRGFFSRVFSSNSGPTDDELDPFAEVFEMSISKQELDLLLIDLAQSGFFDPNLSATGGAWLSVEVDGATSRKTWVPEPRLDDVITRLRADGVYFVADPDEVPADPDGFPPEMHGFPAGPRLLPPIGPTIVPQRPDLPEASPETLPETLPDAGGAAIE